MFSESTKLKVQQFGRFLSNMVMPNIGAFIAWGFITALFIKTGWFPVAALGGFSDDAALQQVEEKIAQLQEIRAFLQSIVRVGAHDAADCPALGSLGG